MRVLCIDDESLNRAVTRSMLTAVGVTVVEAASGAAGLAILDAEPVDAIVLDLRMPDMDGLGVLARIRGRADDKGRVAVIVATADRGVQVREDCLAAGADEVILKPIAMARLFQAIGESMAARAGRKGLAA